MRSINLTDIKILEMNINPIPQNISIKYVIVDELGEIYSREKVETYWITLPNLLTSSDVLLPANYASLVVQLYTAALAALKAKYL